MKRIVSTLVFITLLSSFISSQTYHPFPESDAYWQYTYNDIPMYCPCWGTCHHDQLKITGDTLIGGEIYHKLIKSRISLDSDCDESFHYYGYQGAFRNDIENKKVWFVSEGEENETLLYDFNLQIGDTLPEGILDPNDYWDFWVEDIDSVEIGNNFRKRFIIRSFLNFGEAPLYIIEGIGGQNLIEPFESWWYFEGGYTFSCINVNDSLIYPSNCELFVSDNNNKYSSTLKIFPNPSSGKIWIKHDGKQNLISIEIFNSLGNRVDIIESFTDIKLIDLSDRPRGIYLVNIKTRIKNFTQKVIIQ